MLNVTQFSDTHFSRPGNRSHGGFGYDTDAAWARASAHAYAGTLPDLTVITGDIADHGEADEYLVAAEHLAKIPTPASIVPGNHDVHTPFQVALPRPGLAMDRVLKMGPWLFVFADSNGAGRQLDPSGRLIDKPNRIESNGLLGPAEEGWIDEIITASDSEHVWLWMHHPPAMPGQFTRPDFDAELTRLIDAHPHIRGIGAGHVHTDVVVELADRPVYVCPALTVGFDMTAWTTLPPGYRTYAFADDGTVTSECHLLDDSDLWPRFDLPEAVIAHFQGELGWDELMTALGQTD